METLKHIKAAYTDYRGEIHNLFEGRLGHVALITSKKGTVRGNHYHKQDYQYIYLISGAFESHSCDTRDTTKRQVLNVKAGDLVDTPPYIAHAQKFTEDSVFLSLTTRERESGKYEEDTLQFQVIEGHVNKELKATTK